MTLNKTQGNLVGLFVCIGMMGYALFAQHVQGLEPCNLCIFQRVAVIFLGLVFLLAVIHRPQKQKTSRAYSIGLALATLFGIAVAGRHVYLQSLPADQVPACGPGLDYLLEAMPLAQALKTVFYGSGQCADIDWSFLGLTMPMWVLIMITLVGSTGVWWNWRRYGTNNRLQTST